MIRIASLIIFAIFLLLSPVSAALIGNRCSPYWFEAGLESFHLRRVREGGTHQDGWINGLRLGFDRVKRYGWYVGLDYLYARGWLDGENGARRTLNSELIDSIVEVRFGYTLQQKEISAPFITPFVGWGYFREINDFFLPSPLPCKFTDTFNYVVVGFLSGVNITPLLSMGINFKLKFMQDGKSAVTEDPVFDDVTLHMKEEMHVRLDVPIAFSSACETRRFGFLLSPFFEYRHFGGREGFPFNFKDTKFYLYGAKFSLTYRL